MPIDTTTIDSLEKIYQVRLKREERGYEQQILRVQKCIEEVQNVISEVLILTENLKANRDYMRDVSAYSDPEKMLKALKYKDQLEYDLERQNFYRTLAEDEFVTQQSLLHERLSAIRKYKTRIEYLHKLAKKYQIAVEMREELAQEEVILNVRKAEGLAYV